MTHTSAQESSSVPMPLAARSKPGTRRGPGRPGVQLEDVCAAADALLAKGLKPTIERVRQHLGGGSPNTVSHLLDEWFARLPARLVGVAAPETRPPVGGPPLSVVQIAEQFWEVARRESEQAQLQLSHATRRELELQRDILTQKEAELAQRQNAFEQARAQLDDALAASKASLSALQDQLHTQQLESGRLLAESEERVWRLRRDLDKAEGEKQTVREKMEAELGHKQAALDQAEERHRAHERRLLSELDRERMATRQAAAELGKEQKARASDREAALGVVEKAGQALQAANTKHREAEGRWGRQLQELQVEQATLRERAAGAEQRAGDLVAQMQRQQEQGERQIAQLQDSHAATVAALRQLKTSLRPGKGGKKATG